MKLKAEKLTQFLLRNKFIDESIQKGGIPGVSGCLEHTAILSQLITEAKRRKLDLVVTWLDIANAYGSIPHKLIILALRRAHVPEDVITLVSSYYEDVQIRFTAGSFTTAWHKVEKGIITGCTLSVILFALTMTLLIVSTKGEAKGPKTLSGQQQQNARLYMDDVTTTTETVTQTVHLLEEINRFFTFGRLAVKAEKCRILVIQKGAVRESTVKMAGEEITSIKRKPVKYLGKEYKYTLSDKEQIEDLSTRVKLEIRKIDCCPLAGRYKAWIAQHLLLPRLMWPLSIYSIPQTHIERFGQKLTTALKRWLGFPRSLSSDVMYARSAKLQLPFSSVGEEVKAARVRMKMTLETSKDPCIKGAAINLDSGRKWKVSEAVEQAKSRLRIEEIGGIPNRGREGLGLRHRQYYSKSTLRVQRTLIVNKVRTAEEERRQVKIAGLSKQGASLSWDVPQKVIKDHDLLTLPETRLQFMVKAVYDLLPTPSNKNKWFKTEENRCKLCLGIGTLSHILNGCPVALAQGRYTWRHNKVLEEIVKWIERRRKQVNQLPITKKSWIKFTKGGKPEKGGTQLPRECYLSSARDWKLMADLTSRLRIPESIVVTNLRPDMVLTSESTKQMGVVELTVPGEDRLEVSGELKKMKYEELHTGAEAGGWRVSIWTVEVGSRGFAYRSLAQLLKDMGVEGKEKKGIIRKVEDVAEHCSNRIWQWSNNPSRE